MKRHQPLIFKLQIVLCGQQLQVKALKYATGLSEMLYKVVLPSSLSDVQVCWFAKNKADCKLIMGKPGEPIIDAICLAIKLHEEAPVIYPDTELKLKSA